MELENFEKNINYEFKNKELLKKALTHTSYAHENRVESNEKLEFLGDSILEFIISDYLFTNYAKLKEGEMTKVRASVVCEESLHKVALKHEFNKYLFLGKSEEISGGRNKTAILADSVEALIAAMYIDSDLANAKRFIITNLETAIETASKNVGMKDYKTVLQEKLQQNGTVKIEYVLLEEKGPDHNKTFISEVRCNGKSLAIGEGSTKKASEMQAAGEALKKI